ncbi:MAG: hypothetical protein BWY93_01961 [Euryarchaeota archaeon ADurb.BinA087]|nr:MAG: hypothetical protein BWY93_01961 [Euryarchaeota archaeon ADurb.BinA087]
MKTIASSQVLSYPHQPPYKNRKAKKVHFTPMMYTSLGVLEGFG